MDGFQERFKKHQAYLAEEEAQELEEKAPLIESFRQGCLDIGITLANGAFSYIAQIGIIAAHPDLVSALQLDLSLDKDGLYDFKRLSQLYTKQDFAPGYLYGEKYMLMAHPFFRRGHFPGAAFPPRFIELFWELDIPAIQTFICLDPDRVRINVDNRMWMEKDFWYGAKFRKDICSIPNTAVKLAPPVDLNGAQLSFIFNDVCALDIKWATEGNIKSFYAEEFQTKGVTVSVNGVDRHPAKYVHAEFDLAKGHFRHFDGSLHFYTEDDYTARIASDLNYNTKNNHQVKSQSHKLFRMDGNISIDTWIEFVSHFFSGNPLVFEYFEDQLPEHTQEMVEIIRKNNL